MSDNDDRLPKEDDEELENDDLMDVAASPEAPFGEPASGAPSEGQGTDGSSAGVPAPDAPVAAAVPAGAEQPSAAVAAAVGTPIIWRIKVLYSSATEFCEAPAELGYAIDDTVVITTRYGNELGIILGSEDSPSEVTTDLRVIVRRASQSDLSRAEENRIRDEKAFTVCREKILSRNLDMKLVSAHYLLDEQKILFFFTAENRVDFRELVKDLVSVFKMRIELRQIGVRDEARVIGGLGICGRCLCCNSITDKLRPVSIKMAKEQNLTLNSMKISGPCGRLLCCLSYEFDVYREARQSLPPMGTRVSFDGEEFKAIEMNALARRVRFQGESGRVLDVGFDSLSRNPKTQAWELKLRSGSASSGNDDSAPAKDNG